MEVAFCLFVEKAGMSSHETAHYLCTSMTLSFLQKGAKVFDLLSASAYARQSCTRLTRSICRMSAELTPPYDPAQMLSLAVLAQDVFFSTQLKDSASGKWLGGPQVLLQGTMSGNVTDVIVIMNA